MSRPEEQLAALRDLTHRCSREFERVGHEADRLREQERKVSAGQGALAEGGDDGVTSCRVVRTALDSNSDFIAPALGPRGSGGCPNDMRHPQSRPVDRPLNPPVPLSYRLMSGIPTGV